MTYMISSPLTHVVESQFSFLIPNFSSTSNIEMHTFSVFLHHYLMEITGHTFSWRSISGESVFLIVCLQMCKRFQYLVTNVVIQRKVWIPISTHYSLNAIFLLTIAGTMMVRLRQDIHS